MSRLSVLCCRWRGADPILTPDHVQFWYDAGLRAIGPSHYGPNRYAGGTGTELGLGEMGPALLREMERLGIMLDLTHLSDESFWESLEIYSGPVLASHNNCRAIVPHQRQFSDEQLRAIIERGGVVGMAMDVWMMSTKWRAGQEWNYDIMLEDMVPHIDHICELAGNANNIAIGTDLDGGFGREQSPADLDTIADLQRIPRAVARQRLRGGRYRGDLSWELVAALAGDIGGLTDEEVGVDACCNPGGSSSASGLRAV